MNIDTSKLTSFQLILVNIVSLGMLMFIAASMSLWFSWVLNRFKNKQTEQPTARWTGALATVGAIDVAFAFCCMLFLQFSVVSVYIYRNHNSKQTANLQAITSPSKTSDRQIPVAKIDAQITGRNEGVNDAGNKNQLDGNEVDEINKGEKTKAEPGNSSDQNSESQESAEPPAALPGKNEIQIPIEINLLARSMDVLSVGIVSFFIIFRTNRTKKWIGWGTEKLGSDIAVGVKYFIMFTPIIIAINALVMSMSGTEYNHPIQEMIKKSPWLIAVAFWMACIVAPLTEEFAFRAILIGWFESIQYGRDRLAASMVGEQNPPTTPTSPSWIHPILSGALFGLAHFEYGVSWVPLVVFGIILGRMYQLRQSVWTTVVVHALFNFFSLSMMAFSIFISN